MDSSEDEARIGVSPRTRLMTIVVVAALHLAAIAGLIAAFGVDAVVATVRSVVAFNVPIPPPEPEPEPKAPDEVGKAAPPGAKATARPPVPKPPVVIKPKPKPASTEGIKGADDRSGAAAAGAGSGLAGQGSGTGAGGGLATKPSVRSGNLDRAKDFSVPDGGRETRFGKAVTVTFTVTAEGRARDCKVANSSVDARTTAEVCPLVERKIRFNPATDRSGKAVEARYGYRVDFRAQ